jgi:hypothetical protein
METKTKIKHLSTAEIVNLGCGQGDTCRITMRLHPEQNDKLLARFHHSLDDPLSLVRFLECQAPFSVLPKL